MNPSSEGGFGGDTRDPGWRPAFTKPQWLLLLALPVFGTIAARGARLERCGALVRVRVVFVSRVVSLALICLVTLRVVGEQEQRGEVGLWWALLVGIGTLDTAMVWWARTRPLDPSNPDSLRQSYVATFMLGTAVALSSALIGFVLVFITGHIEPLFVGMVFSLVGLAMIAPTRREIERREQELRSKGSPLSLVDVLVSTTTG